MISTYDPTRGIASIIDRQTGMSVHTLLQHPGVKQPAISAFLGARYSRSNKSMPDILAEIQDIDAAERLAKIFHGYGHASVGDMAHVFIFIEKVPAITAMQFFYQCPKQDGQERSTRYQTFNEASFGIPFPSQIGEELKEEFYTILKKQLKDYRQLTPLTYRALLKKFNLDADKHKAALKARTLDVARYLLPMGISTNFAAVMSARDWCKYISYLLGSNSHLDKRLGVLLLNLLTGNETLLAAGYVPEVAELIRHVKPNKVMLELMPQLIKVLEDAQLSNQDMAVNEMTVSYLSVRNAIADHVAMTQYPGCRVTPKKLISLSESFGNLLLSHFDQYNQIGPLAQSGAIQIKGRTDIGVLKDLNRHRSLERFIPFFEPLPHWKVVTAPHFKLAAYLDELPSLQNQYKDCLSETQNLIEQWGLHARDFLEPTDLVEYYRYLSPHARLVDYALYGSFDDLQYTIRTRIRPGGHINYRNEVYNWLICLVKNDPFWTDLATLLKQPDATNLDEFLDRS